MKNETKGEKPRSVWDTLSAIDCSQHVEKKNGLTYLSWAWAWSILKKNYPEATSTIYDDANGNNYFTDGRTCWVKTGVTVEGIEHVEELPVMDFKNKSIPLENVTSYEVNKTIQRSMTKAIARHGLGMYIYAGEDLPEEADGKTEVKPAPKAVKAEPKPDPLAAARKCWEMYRALPAHNGVERAKLGEMFGKFVVDTTKHDAKSCTASDWDKVAEAIAKIGGV